MGMLLLAPTDVREGSVETTGRFALVCALILWARESEISRCRARYRLHVPCFVRGAVSSVCEFDGFVLYRPELEQASKALLSFSRRGCGLRSVRARGIEPL